MEPIEIKGANRRLGAPKDWNVDRDGECATLPVFVDMSTEGSMILQSAWKPNQDELKALANGSPVILMVWGTGMPAVALAVSAEAYDECEQLNTRVGTLELAVDTAGLRKVLDTMVGCLRVQMQGAVETFWDEVRQLAADGHITDFRAKQLCERFSDLQCDVIDKVAEQIALGGPAPDLTDCRVPHSKHDPCHNCDPIGG